MRSAKGAVFMLPRATVPRAEHLHVTVLAVYTGCAVHTVSATKALLLDSQYKHVGTAFGHTKGTGYETPLVAYFGRLQT